MTPLILLVAIVPTVLIIPAWLISKRRNDESNWLLFIGWPAILVWFLLVSAGFGAQSLSNLAELFYIGMFAILTAYIKVFLVDKVSNKYIRNTYIAAVAVVLFCILLRIFMPPLPE